MTGLLIGRIAFVTGGAGGIGAASAIAMAREGAKVAVTDIRAPDHTVATIAAAGGEALAITLTSPARAPSMPRSTKWSRGGDGWTSASTTRALRWNRPRRLGHDQ